MTAESVMPILVRLELDLSAQPLAGTVRGPGGSAEPFVGWLGLTAALERLRVPPQAPEPEVER